jgi:hypothetical protein
LETSAVCCAQKLLSCFGITFRKCGMNVCHEGSK